MLARLALFSCLALTAGCAVGPNYRRPDTRPPTVFRGQEGPEDRSLADLAWWDLYRDPLLTRLVRESLENGYDARIAAVRVEEARAVEMEARGQLFPAIEYQADANRGRNAQLGRPNPAGNGSIGNGFDAYLSAAWELDLWGRVRRLDEAARDRYLASEEARRGVVLSLIGEVATAYFQLIELDEELAISRRASDAFNQSLKLFNQRLKGGIASKLETSSAEAAQAAAAARIPALELQIATTENRLGVLLGRDPGPIARRGALSDPIAAPDVPAGLPSALLERRPDVREAEYAARAANAQLGVTIGNFLPRIGLSAILGGVSPRLQDLTSRQAELWSAGAQVTGPIFQAGALRGEYLQSKEAWEEAKLQYQRAALNAFADVADELATRQKLIEIRSQEEIEVRAYRTAVDVARKRYRAGQAGYYELLQTQEQLYPAENALAQTQRDELISIVQLYKALGGGWSIQATMPN